MQPLEFHPLLRRLRWGGRRLGTVLGKPLGPEADYAESWEIADHGADQSVVLDGPHAGRTLGELVGRHAAELLGRHAGLAQFPLLVKFLDAADRLSVQVHPDDRQARTHDPAENGKTEAWIVLAADPGSRLYAGLQPGVDRARLAATLSAGTVEDCLHSFTPSPGDCVFIPAGTVHAIGEGLLLAEIQQSSDLTFRMYDWGRLGSDGRPRELHIEQALDCTDFSRGPCGPIIPRPVSDGSGLAEELVRCEHFVIRRRRVREPFTVPRDGRFRILMALEGRADLHCGDGRRTLTPGRTLLVPAVGDEVRIAPAESVVLLEAFLPLP